DLFCGPLRRFVSVDVGTLGQQLDLLRGAGECCSPGVFQGPRIRELTTKLKKI
ncbi:MAG: hypothetical protein H0T42_06695, partial [Deltaproteobacteria bacterium]|nr:hypothetical protein [Deltaproteobacteria bacterium]